MEIRFTVNGDQEKTIKEAASNDPRSTTVSGYVRAAAFATALSDLKPKGSITVFGSDPKATK